MSADIIPFLLGESIPLPPATPDRSLWRAYLVQRQTAKLAEMPIGTAPSQAFAIVKPQVEAEFRARFPNASLTGSINQPKDAAAVLFGDAYRAEPKSKIQTLIFSKSSSPPDVNEGDGWTVAAAKAWAKDNDFKSNKVDEPESGETIRLRQFDRTLCKKDSFVSLTKNFPKGITATSCTVEG